MANTFLEDLLKSQELDSEDNSQLEQHEQEVRNFLAEKFDENPVIKIAGSVKKGTAIHESYDLDIVVYFPSSDERSLKQIYDDMVSLLSEEYTIQPKTSAVRITGLQGNEDNNDYHIDVVPGRFIKDSEDVFLHVSYGDKERMQTNLKTHIEHVVNSNCEDIIKLVKIWKKRNNVEIRTFVLELFVIKHLEDVSDKSDLENCFITVMSAFRDNQIIGLVDPANSNNNVSQTMTDSQKEFVASKASETLETLDNGDLSGEEKWSMIFKQTEEKSQSRTSVVMTGMPNKPWLSE